MDSTFRVRFWGTRGSIPTPGAATAVYGGNTSCVEVEVGGRLLIFDAGTGIRPLGADLLMRRPSSPIDARIFISHTHWDHIQGIPFFAPLYVAGNRFDLYGPPGVDQYLERVIRGQMDPHYFPVEMSDAAASIAFHECDEPALAFDDIEVRTHFLNHPTMTLAYRVTSGGRSIVYATDHEQYRRMYATRGDSAVMLELAERHDADFARFIAGADLYIAEAQYTLPEYRPRLGWGHSTVDDVVTLASTAGVKHVVLYHHDPSRTDAAVEQILAGARSRIAEERWQLECTAAREGALIEL